MEWWNDLWLNEGFAQYFEALCTTAIHPDWNILEEELVELQEYAFNVDSLSHTHSIRVDVVTPDDIVQVFDSISYNKGAGILHMVHKWLGDDTFQLALQNYLNSHKYMSARSSDLWNSLAYASNDDDLDFKLDTWITNEGFPLISLEGKTSLTVKQQRFLFNSELHDEATWWVPLEIISFDSNNLKTVSKHDFTAFSVNMNIDDSTVWYKANTDHSAMYRVNYDEDNWNMILDNFDTGVLSSLDRAGIINDVLAIARTGEVSYDIAFKFLKKLESETEHIVWDSALNELYTLFWMVLDEHCFGDFQDAVHDMVLPQINRLNQFTSSADDSRNDIILRGSLLGVGLYTGDSDLIATARELFDKHFEENYPIESNLLGDVLMAGVRYGSHIEFELVLEAYKTEENEQTKMRFLRALASTRERYLLDTLLDYSLQPDIIREQDTLSLLRAIAYNPEGTDLAWNFVREVHEKFHNDLLLNAGSLIEITTSRFNTLVKLKEVEEFVEEIDTTGSERSIARALEKIQLNIDWVENHSDAVCDQVTNF
eukprot:TRINITY_DN3310_c0_g2_i1.p1 TRINITY_DN3310_c0_g2~~TRINITY_DN3310_c0_g2_i1.p1  ORF type:complete len:549 (+),score=140.80 TRINITY_DN3310_c0_g2_i1:26-1648(+)